MWLIFPLALLGLMVGIFNPEPPPRLFEHADKYEHFIAFMAVSLSGAFYFSREKYQLLYWVTWLVMAYMLEYGQGYYLPKRTFDMYDVYANVGGVIGAFCIWVLGVYIYNKM